MSDEEQHGGRSTFEVRGLYIERWLQVEMQMQSAIATFMGWPLFDDRLTVFFGPLFREFAPAALIRLLQQTIDIAGLGEEFPDLPSRIRQASEVRNVLAHAFANRRDEATQSSNHTVVFVPRLGRKEPRTFDINEVLSQADEILSDLLRLTNMYEDYNRLQNRGRPVSLLRKGDQDSIQSG